MSAFARVTNDRVATGASAFVGAIHLLLCAYVHTHPTEGSWQWFPVFILDFPASLIPLFITPNFIPAVFAFGTVGTAWWFALTWMLVHLARQRLSKVQGT